MQWLVKLYDRTLIWSQHKNAPRYLAAVSFVEASVFPIPPYFMLAPMALSKPDKALQYAFIATTASVLGGVLGYLLGYLVFNPVVLPVLEYLGHVQNYELITQQLQAKGFWAVLIAGFTPIPYKLVAIGAGVMRIPIQEFLFASIFGRGLKFFLVAVVIRAGGLQMEQRVRQMIPKFGLIFISLVFFVLALKIFKVI